MLGVDRLDMVKGIPQKLLAYEKFLEVRAWVEVGRSRERRHGRVSDPHIINAWGCRISEPFRGAG